MVAAVVMAAAVLPRTARGTDLTGGARLVAGGWIDGLAVAETEGGPRERPRALIDLHLDGEATRWLRGRLDLRAAAGGPFEGGHPGVLNLNHEFQNRSPSLEVGEAWVETHLRHADVRLGIQKVAWGKLDGVPPTDVVNPRDYHDPIVEDFEERKIGVPMMLGTGYLPDVPALALSGLRATLLWVPIAVPPRLPLIEERWFPSESFPGRQFVVPRRVVSRVIGEQADEDLIIPIHFRTLNRHPPRMLDAGGVGFRLGGAWRDTDWDIYHYTGPETGPDADLRSEAMLLSAIPLRVRSDTFLRQAHDVVHMSGGDLATTLGGFTLRAEVAYFQDRPYLRPASDLVRDLPVEQLFRDLLARPRVPVPLGDLFPTLDSVEWGVGADYLFHGWEPVLQVNQIVLLDRAPRLLIADPETRLSGTLRKRWFAERFEVELRGTYAIERQAWVFLPRLSYLVRDDLRVRVGYLAVDGPRASLLGQFRSNDEVVLQARYTF